MINLVLICASVCLLYAAISDLYCRRIPNVVVVSVFVIGAMYKLLQEKYCDVFLDLIPFFVILSIGFFAFQYRVLAGGDVKLLSVSGYLVGMEGWLVLCVWTAVFGGVLALTILVWRLIVVLWGVFFGQRKRHPDLRKMEIPYGVAIAAAAILVMARHPVTRVLEVSP